MAKFQPFFLRGQMLDGPQPPGMVAGLQKQLEMRGQFAFAGIMEFFDRLLPERAVEPLILPIGPGMAEPKLAGA